MSSCCSLATDPGRIRVQGMQLGNVRKQGADAWSLSKNPLAV